MRVSRLRSSESRAGCRGMASFPVKWPNDPLQGVRCRASAAGRERMLVFVRTLSSGAAAPG